MKKILLSLLLASTLVNAESIGIDSVGANLGLAGMPTDQVDKSGSLTLDRDPDELYFHGELYTLIGGVFSDTSYKPTLNVIANINSDFNNYMLLAGVNKYFEYETYDLYLGLLAGAGYQNWSYNPLHSTQTTDKSSSSPVGAIQAGAEYDLTNSLHLGVNTKLYAHQYTAVLEPTTSTSSEINHNFSYSLSVGLRYSFGETAQESSTKQETPAITEETAAVSQEQEVTPEVVAVIDPDKDKDGVLNENDICANTPLDKTVDKDGCQKLDSFTIAFAPLYITLQEKYHKTLQTYANFLKEHPSYSAKVIGYTDAIGSEKINQQLSEARADIVATYLMINGVSSKQISYEGKGEANPIGDNSTEEGRAKNRRVAISFSRK